VVAREHLGDRVEGALETRADAERQIAEGEARRPTRRRVLRGAFWLAITGVSLYLVAPAVIETASSWQDLTELAPGWAAAAVAVQALAVVCLWWLQRIAMHQAPWYAVSTSQLAGNGMAKVAPGGGAVGAALQYKMLVEAGIDAGRAVAGLTASNLLTLAIVLALPVLALPALVRGGVDRGLAELALGGFAIFVVLAAAGAVAFSTDGALRWVGRVVQRARNGLRRHAAPVTDLPDRLVHERDRVRDTVGERWRSALAAGIGRWAFDYATLVAALAAVDSHPRPALVLLAFCAAQLLAQLPLTPGGLGFVEAGLTATLALAGVGAGAAVLATFAYRLLTYWLPMPLGVAGAILHHRRYAAAAPVLAVDR
jgi:uncharacterized protein (TIRG00374 family)